MAQTGKAIAVGFIVVLIAVFGAYFVPRLLQGMAVIETVPYSVVTGVLIIGIAAILLSTVTSSGGGVR